MTQYTTSIHAVDVNHDHFRMWVHQMRTTTLPQATGHLAAWVMGGPGADDQIGYCCLGLGSLLVPDCEVVRAGDGDGEENNAGYFGRDGATDLAPIEFIQWLVPGYDNENNGHEFDLVPDWALSPGVPANTQGVKDTNVNTGEVQAEGRNRFPLANITAAKMNDDGFSFAQIADVFAYFGIGSVQASR